MGSKIFQEGNKNVEKRCRLPEARENVSDLVFGFVSAFEWLRERQYFSRPITEQGKAKPV